jgi:hypothetical protein
MRPTGWESKNCIRDLITWSSARACSLAADLTKAVYRNTEPTEYSTAASRKKIQKKKKRG